MQVRVMQWELRFTSGCAPGRATITGWSAAYLRAERRGTASGSGNINEPVNIPSGGMITLHDQCECTEQPDGRLR